MNYRRSRKQTKQSKRSKKQRRTRNRRGGGFTSPQVIIAYNTWQIQNGRPDRATSANPEGGHLIITGKRKESDGDNSIMLGRYNIKENVLQILHPDLTTTDLDNAQITALLNP